MRKEGGDFHSFGVMESIDQFGEPVAVDDECVRIQSAAYVGVMVFRTKQINGKFPESGLFANPTKNIEVGVVRILAIEDEGSGKRITDAVVVNANAAKV